MADNPSFSAPSSAFESLLDRMEARDGAAARIAPPMEQERFQPCLTITMRQTFRVFAAIAAYGGQADDGAPPSRPDRVPLETHFARIRKELGAARSVEDLRRLRRTCALLVHPDRLPTAERPAAEKFMAEINAAIDRAIMNKSAARRSR
ncbi:J domain-containing protein [Rhodoblastus acidophilus]|uniref:J domain-containing protein n=1 Tax=Candidatus Rhodoblastus alkanivorans TaxID=2954117 RepID=A0ABS9Z3I0_9HYPH|nr:J domain-containing protein [Candidatus Rhodoblastus alkanivorans]MCI4678840.1 J domain-containing protein [Candidatus Rhodoblastus alkanivorans]MCI4682229.1 J domain-containing protein [Candidatus Rhodoblastus alkanivorans]MDI4639531.1 J domain-containing protein [Rhodoblastus acidophilus]